jgi:hypothetical protein
LITIKKQIMEETILTLASAGTTISTAISKR